jgi:hypothetical protein
VAERTASCSGYSGDLRKLHFMRKTSRFIAPYKQKICWICAKLFCNPLILHSSYCKICENRQLLLFFSINEKRYPEKGRLCIVILWLPPTNREFSRDETISRLHPVHGSQLMMSVRLRLTDNLTGTSR